MRKQSNSQVFRITGARQGLADDVRGRQRRYVISMSVRTLSVIAAAVLWNVERHVAVVALVLGVILPYISVVIANAGRENAPSLPSTFVSAPTRLEALPTRSAVGESTPSRFDESGRDAESVAEDVPGKPAAGARSEPRARSRPSGKRS